MKKFTIFIFASLMLATGLMAQKAPIVGVVDMQRVLAEFTEFQSAVEKVRGSVAPVEEEMQRMQTSIQAIVTEGREIETRRVTQQRAKRRVQRLQLRSLSSKQSSKKHSLANQFRQQAQALAQKARKRISHLSKRRLLRQSRQSLKTRELMLFSLGTTLFTLPMRSRFLTL